VCSQLRGLRKAFTFKVDPIAPIDGLTVRTGLVECSECKQIYSKGSLPAHHSKDHAGVTRVHLKDLHNVHV